MTSPRDKPQCECRTDEAIGLCTKPCSRDTAPVSATRALDLCPENMQPCDMGCTGGWCVTLHGSPAVAATVADQITTTDGPCTPEKLAAATKCPGCGGMGFPAGSPGRRHCDVCGGSGTTLSHVGDIVDAFKGSEISDLTRQHLEKHGVIPPKDAAKARLDKKLDEVVAARANVGERVELYGESHRADCPFTYGGKCGCDRRVLPSSTAAHDAIALLRKVKAKCHDDLPLDLWREIEDFLAFAPSATEERKK